MQGHPRPLTLALAAWVTSLAVGVPVAGVEADEVSQAGRFQGEELYYSLEFFGSSLARGALIMGQAEEREGTLVLPVSGLALTEGVAAMIYPMRDEGTTLIDAHTGMAQTTLKELDERGEYRSYQVDFLLDEYRGQVARVREGVTSHYERLLPSTTHDALSWIYTIRNQDLTPATSQIYYIYDGWKLSRVTATVVDDDQDILVGEEWIPCRRINLYREVLDSTRPLPMIQETAALPPALWPRPTASGEQVGNLMLSRDERRLPVQMEFSNAIITATARLTQYRPPAVGYTASR